MDQIDPPFNQETNNIPSNLPESESDAMSDEIKELYQKLGSSDAPADLKKSVSDSLIRLNRAMKYSLHQAEFEQTSKYVSWITSLPWQKRSEDTIDLQKAREVLEKNHYGLTVIKERILEYLAVLKLQSERVKDGHVKFARSSVLYFTGMPGTGKTSFASSLAEAMNRQFVRIPMGGMSSLMMLRGQPRAYPQAEPGLIIKALRRAGTRNPVILLDEMDSLSQGEQSDLMGVLLELLDPEQNNAFVDYYIDYPVDLSEVLFVSTGNKLGNMSPAVMDRLEVIMMPRYTETDKMSIAKNYLLPRELEATGFDPGFIQFSDEVWPLVIKPFGYDIDLRSIQRTLGGILRKVAKRSAEGDLHNVTITRENIREFLPEFI
jgi:ATP-dependent Lon protease